MTAMTRAECERLGILGPDVMREMGETEASIQFVNDRRIEAAADAIENGADLLTVFGSLCRPTPLDGPDYSYILQTAPSQVCKSIIIDGEVVASDASDEDICAAVSRLNDGDSLAVVISDLCRPTPPEKL